MFIWAKIYMKPATISHANQVEKDAKYSQHLSILGLVKDSSKKEAHIIHKCSFFSEDGNYG